VRAELSNMEERYDAAWAVIGRLLSQWSFAQVHAATTPLWRTDHAVLAV